MSVQESNYLLHHNRHGQHEEEEQNTSVSWPGERHKPSLSAQLDWTPHNTLWASAAGPAFPISSAFSCAKQWYSLPLPLGNLPDKHSHFASS